MPKVALTSDEHAWRITLDAPPLHILDIALLEELRDALARVTPDRHALVIAASGDRAFSAGASVQDHLGDRVATMLRVFHDCFRALARLDLVTVALVRGAALGGGCELALACDFVLASDRARFGQPEIALGVFPPVAAYQLSRQLPPRKGLELLLTGDAIDAARAEQLGLVNVVFTDAEFDAHANAWLERLYRHSASSVRLAKKAFRLAQADEFEARLAATERLYLDELARTHDANEGLNAFLEKRSARWEGR
ncbi:MAG: enoyl-CoA hydratase/isomerase family protein [Acidobacteria bacterium]|nr:enoyl-CoA hydratase/isomerase family protein [Acidobacteriota bacterium]MBV9475186.1 enoyl-CoA hydratase/isomerase family protein [Acidobacteriota bacterium]